MANTIRKDTNGGRPTSGMGNSYTRTATRTPSANQRIANYQSAVTKTQRENNAKTAKAQSELRGIIKQSAKSAVKSALGGGVEHYIDTIKNARPKETPKESPSMTKVATLRKSKPAPVTGSMPSSARQYANRKSTTSPKSPSYGSGTYKG